ncbi:methyl-accepting chemotaxis protein [Desulfosporosinus sp. Sb-LF]|uniref:methyl-accepting chemotaxis protein n=1 Tax=Desulfosporosinus sp. Sb-LF TaxID=2560027 RepID=UPI0013052BC4|nr:methyl-accepting chemotaxis protein [Desulfosporosinus sp. Sb-LF]
MFNLKNIKIGRKLGLGFGIIVLIVMVVGSIGYYGITLMSQEMRYISGNSIPDLQNLATLNYQRMVIRADSMTVAATESQVNADDTLKSVMTRRKASWEIVDRSWGILVRTPQTSDQGRELMKQLEGEYTAWRTLYVDLDRTIEQIALNTDAKQKRALYAKYSELVVRMIPISDKMGATFDRITENNVVNTNQIIKEHIAKADFLKLLSLITIVSSIVLVIILSVVITRSVSVPIMAAVEFLTCISQGDLIQEVPKTLCDRKDENGDLARSMQTMIENLRTQIRDISQVSNGLVLSASEIASSVSQVTSGAQENSAAVMETTTTVEEVKQTVNVTSQKAREVADKAQQGLQVAYDGRQTSENLAIGMQHIREQMTLVADTIMKLSEQSQVIIEITTTVEDLADQSNLLAVNAAIEAAKAGEHGKGFAVVAQEIKSLAEQSKQATKQVRSILNDIQKATGAAVMATEQGSKAVDEGMKEATRASESIQALSKNFSESTQSAAQIAAANKEQLMAIDQVTSAMQNIEEVTTQNVASMRHLEIAVQSLKDMGQNLSRTVTRYKV